VHGAALDPLIHCDECGGVMRRKPQMVRVTWGGPPPSAGGKHPLVERLNATYAERVDAFARKKEEHVKRTEGEDGASG
jgi:hypothetical protein